MLVYAWLRYYPIGKYITKVHSKLWYVTKHGNDVLWASWRLQSQAIRLFVQPTTKKISKFRITGPSWPVNSPHVGPVMQKQFQYCNAIMKCPDMCDDFFWYAACINGKLYLKNHFDRSVDDASNPDTIELLWFTIFIHLLTFTNNSILTLLVMNFGSKFYSLYISVPCAYNILMLRLYYFHVFLFYILTVSLSSTTSEWLT